MEISAEIVKGISYQPLLQKQLKQVSLSDFDINKTELQNSFFQMNNFNIRQILLTQNLFAEARQNNFVVRIGN
jgi:hypothetical protein